MPPTPRLRALLVALVLAATGCVAIETSGPEVTDADDAPADGLFDDGTPTDDPTVEAPQDGDDLEVPLEVIQGPEGSILAFVPVMIDGQGPYSFALDTGASSSVIDASVAEELELEEVGEVQGVTGVTGATEAARVQLEDWQTGEVDLGARPAIVLDLGGGDDGPGIEGLVGSDVLSEFGAITVDYDEGVLRLRPQSG